MYRAQGYYEATVEPVVLPQPDGQVRVVFQIHEGPRVAISQILVTGNSTFSDDKIVDQMATKPEGFWWFQPGRLDDERLSRDMRERLPAWYGDHGYIDFEVTGDSLAGRLGDRQGRPRADRGRGAGLSHRHLRHRGQPAVLARGAVVRSTRTSTCADTTSRFRPFFSQGAWDKATEMVKTLYGNNGYIYSRVEPQQTRRIAKDGTPMIDLRWTIVEGPPATINKIEIVGNDVTHERVIREAIVMRAGPAVQPRPAAPLVPEHLQHRLLPAADGAARRPADGQRRGRQHHLPGPGEADRQHQLRRLGRAGHRHRRLPRTRRSRISSGRASGAACSGSSAGTSTTSL